MRLQFYKFSKPLARVERAINDIVAAVNENRLASAPDYRIKATGNGTALELLFPKSIKGESGTLQFKGEHDPLAPYSKGDIVIRGSNNARGPGPLNANSILQNGHIAGTYIALVNIAAAPQVQPNPGPGEPDATGQWETVSRGAWHLLTIRPTNPQKTHGIELNATGDYIVFRMIGTNGRTVTIDIENPLGPLRANAGWVEIDVCQNGIAKKMQVLGTPPYLP